MFGDVEIANQVRFSFFIIILKVDFLRTGMLLRSRSGFSQDSRLVTGTGTVTGYLVNGQNVPILS
jgi:hypothetical protein